MTRDLADKRLELTPDIIDDDQALELISVWFTGGKAKVFTRKGTPLDERPQIWAEILVGIIENLADHVSSVGFSKRECVRKIGEIVSKLCNEAES